MSETVSVLSLIHLMLPTTLYCQRYILLLPLFYRWGNQAVGKLNNLPQESSTGNMNPESMLLAVDHLSTTLWIMILSRQYGGELKGPNQKPCCGLCSDPGMSPLPDSTFTLLLGFYCHWKRVFMVFMLVSQIHQPLPIFCLQTEF